MPGDRPARAGIVVWRLDPELGVVVGSPRAGGRHHPPAREVGDVHPLAAALSLLPRSVRDVGAPGPHVVDEAAEATTWWWPVQTGEDVPGLDWRPAAGVAEDHPALGALLRGDGPTAYRQVVLVRHARAGSREEWTGPDAERTLDLRGRTQAMALAGLLRAYRVERIHSSDARRCLDTVGPLGAALGLPVLAEPLLSEDGSAEDPVAAQTLLGDLVDGPEQTVVCTQRKTLGRLLPALLKQVGLPADAAGSPRKGGLLVLHLPRAGGRPVAEQLPPPVA